MANFKTLKERITMQAVLEHYGIFDTLELRGSSHRGECPFCQAENTFSVSTEKNCFNCFNDTCKAHGDIIDFVMRMEGFDKKEAGNFLAKIFSENNKPPRTADSGTPVGQSGMENIGVADEGSRLQSKRILVPTIRTANKEPLVVTDPGEVSNNPPLGFSLNGIDPSHSTVSDLGITQSTTDTFGVGYYTGNSKQFKNHVVIPIHNSGKALIAYTGIDPESGNLEHVYPPKFRKDLEFYNPLVNPLTTLSDEQNDKHGLLVVRDPLAAILLTQAGYERSIAFMDNRISDEHVSFLIRHYGARAKITLLCCRNDEYAIENLSKLLTLFFVRLCRYEKKDGRPTGFTADDIHNILI